MGSVKLRKMLIKINMPKQAKVPDRLAAYKTWLIKTESLKVAPHYNKIVKIFEAVLNQT